MVQIVASAMLRFRSHSRNHLARKKTEQRNQKQGSHRRKNLRDTPCTTNSSTRSSFSPLLPRQRRVNLLSRRVAPPPRSSGPGQAELFFRRLERADRTTSTHGPTTFGERESVWALAAALFPVLRRGSLPERFPGCVSIRTGSTQAVRRFGRPPTAREMQRVHHLYSTLRRRHPSCNWLTAPVQPMRHAAAPPLIAPATISTIPLRQAPLSPPNGRTCSATCAVASPPITRPIHGDQATRALRSVITRRRQIQPSSVNGGRPRSQQ